MTVECYNTIGEPVDYSEDGEHIPPPLMGARLLLFPA